MNREIEYRIQMGERIRKIRNELKMTKEALARNMGVTGQFIGIVENGRSMLSYDKLRKLCDISGYSADYILFGKNNSDVGEIKDKIKTLSEEQILEALEIIGKLAILIINKSSEDTTTNVNNMEEDEETGLSKLNVN